MIVLLIFFQLSRGREEELLLLISCILLVASQLYCRFVELSGTTWFVIPWVCFEQLLKILDKCFANVVTSFFSSRDDGKDYLFLTKVAIFSCWVPKFPNFLLFELKLEQIDWNEHCWKIYDCFDFSPQLVSCEQWVEDSLLSRLPQQFTLRFTCVTQDLQMILETAFQAFLWTCRT